MSVRETSYIIASYRSCSPSIAIAITQCTVAPFLCHLLQHMIWHFRIPIAIIVAAGMIHFGRTLIALIAHARNAESR